VIDARAAAAAEFQAAGGLAALAGVVSAGGRSPCSESAVGKVGGHHQQLPQNPWRLHTGRRAVPQRCPVARRCMRFQCRHQISGQLLLLVSDPGHPSLADSVRFGRMCFYRGFIEVGVDAGTAHPEGAGDGQRRAAAF